MKPDDKPPLWSAQTRPQPFPKTREPEDDRQRPADIEMPPPLFFPGDRVYVPFETRSRPESLILFCAKMPSQFPPYHHLLNISFDHHHGETFTLFYPFMAVNVTGHRLAEIVHAINFRRCAIIREWHRDLYDPPGHGIAVVRTIEIASSMVNGEQKAEA